jgi:hypothetical protein
VSDAYETWAEILAEGKARMRFVQGIAVDDDEAA